MKPTTAIALLLLGAATVAAGVQLRPRVEAMPQGAGHLMFPGIADRLDRAQRIVVTGSGKTSTLVRQDGRWTLAERGSYPIQPPKMRSLLAGLVELRLLEPRTADPASLARLGVDDPASPSSTAVAMKVTTEDGTVLADLLLGHRSQRSQGGLPETVYVRRPAETRTWLAEGRIPGDADPQSWLIREVIDIPADSVAHIAVSHGMEKIEFVRSGDGMVLANPPAGKIDEYRLGEVAKALEGVTLADVRRGPLPGQSVGNVVFTTTAGLVIDASVAREDKQLWASFAAHGTGAEALQGLAGWAFHLPEWRQTALVPAISDLIGPEPVK
jgi:hypothetical protein